MDMEGKRIFCTVNNLTNHNIYNKVPTLRSVSVNISFQRVITVQQTRRSSATGTEIQRLLSSSSVLCFRKLWLCGWMPDSTLKLAGFQLLRTDHDTELSGKAKDGGIALYNNSGWCNDVTVIQQRCSPDQE